MIPTRTDQPLTCLELFCGSADSSPKAAADQVLAPALRSHPRVLEGVPEVVRPAATNEVASAIAGLLGFSLIGLVVDAWRGHHRLTAAAKRTLARPNSTEVVQLVTHSFTVTQRPQISVFVNSSIVTTMELELILTFEVTALIASVHLGRLTTVHSGRCDITGTLAIPGTEILRRTGRIELPGAISLHEGIRLLPRQDYALASRGPSAGERDLTGADRPSTQTIRMAAVPAEEENTST